MSCCVKRALPEQHPDVGTKQRCPMKVLSEQDAINDVEFVSAMLTASRCLFSLSAILAWAEYLHCFNKCVIAY